jgi:replicative DNA helicase
VSRPDEEEFHRTPPHDNDAEMSTLGAMMLSGSAIDDATDLIEAGDFYRPAHEAVFAAIAHLHAHGEPVDAVTVAGELQRRGDLVRVGGAPYLHDLVAKVPTATNAAFYARIVRERGTARRLVEAGTRIVQMGYQGTDGDADVENARREVDAVGRAVSGLRLIADELVGTVLALDDEVESMPTPWPDLNHLIGGLRPGGLYIVGARPGVGKSLMANGLAMGLAKHGGVALNNLEMSTREVHERMLSAVADVPYTRIVNRCLEPSDRVRLEERIDRLEVLPISIDDRPMISTTDIRSHARTLARRGPLAGVIVDYLQLMASPRGDRRPRHEIVGDMSRSLKILAKELHVPVVALSQLNRGPEGRTDKRPTMGDLRESGSLEQDADVVILLHVEENDPGTMHVSVQKNRQGATSGFKLVRRGHVQRLDTVAWSPTDAVA